MKWYKGISVEQDPDAKLTWKFDLTDWLSEGESLAAHTVSVPTGLTLESSSISGNNILAQISGGVAGQTYTVTCRATATGSGDIDDFSVDFEIAER